MEDISGKHLGPYVVVAPLGEGGMAAVYKAYQPSVDRYLALKVLPRQYAADPNFKTRFSREARVIAKLEHQNILPVFDYGETDDYTFIAMRFVDTGTLADLLQGGPLPLPQILQIVSQVGSALDYAHSQGVIHRDVKPSNILIDRSGNCLLSDFGLAKMVEGTVQLTATGGILGTPAYMAPEQCLGEPTDARSDIYALGVVLYEMATGQLPFRAETPLAVLLKHVHDPLPLPRNRNPSLPETVERVILKAMAKAPADRYATAGEMVQASEAAIAGRAAPGAPPVATRAQPRVAPPRVEPARPPQPPVDLEERAEAASAQIHMYWNVLSFGSVAVILFAISAIFGVVSLCSIPLARLFMYDNMVNGKVVWGPVILPILVPLSLTGLFYVLGWWPLRRSKQLQNKLDNIAKKEGNFYVCPCGTPKERYPRVILYLCVFTFPFGLIFLLFRRKKCRKCRRPYLPQLSTRR